MLEIFGGETVLRPFFGKQQQVIPVPVESKMDAFANRLRGFDQFRFQRLVLVRPEEPEQGAEDENENQGKRKRYDPGPPVGSCAAEFSRDAFSDRDCPLSPDITPRHKRFAYGFRERGKPAERHDGYGSTSQTDALLSLERFPSEIHPFRIISIFVTSKYGWINPVLVRSLPSLTEGGSTPCRGGKGKLPSPSLHGSGWFVGVSAICLTGGAYAFACAKLSATCAQLTVFHHASMYSARRF